MRNFLALMKVGALILLTGCSSGLIETSTNKYSSRNEAAEKGAIERGWLPQTLPTTAHDIIETHNIDTSEIWLRFRYETNELDPMLHECLEQSEITFPDASRVRRMAPWWPAVLSDKADRRLPSGMRAYRCREMSHAGGKYNAYLVIDPEKLTAWYWVLP